MKGYGQFCPVAKAAEVFAERWTPLVVRELLAGSVHFNDLHRGVPLMSRTLLSQRLRSLEESGVVSRRRGERGPEYHLTEAGRELAPLVRLLGEWGQRWYRTSYRRDELDMRVLMWNLRQAIKRDALPAGRVSVQFEFTDVPAAKRNWWLVSDGGGEIDLCPADPGFEVDLFVTTDVKTLTQVVLGDLTVSAAVRSGRIELEGQQRAAPHFRDMAGLELLRPGQARHGRLISQSRIRPSRVAAPCPDCVSILGGDLEWTSLVVFLTCRIQRSRARILYNSCGRSSCRATSSARCSSSRPTPPTLSLSPI